jgi:outer membrane lipoprotein carrier protein
MQFLGLALFSFILASSVSLAEQSRRDDAGAVARSIESRYQRARTLKAAFFERFSDGNGGVAAESGTVYFSRPGRMRWEYESPTQKLFIVDGANVWFYVPEERTVSRAKFKESDDWRTPIALLAGKADLSKLCRSLVIVVPAAGLVNGKDQAPRAAGDTLLRCVPRGNTADSDSPKDVLMETDSESRLVRVVIREPGSAETEFRFGNWQENIAVPEAKFHFQPPPGVTVVDEASLASQIH